MSIGQSSSIPEMMKHAGFRRVGSSWRRTINGITYVAEAFDRKPVTTLGAVYVRAKDSFPASFRAFDTVLHMALTLGVVPA